MTSSYRKKRDEYYRKLASLKRKDPPVSAPASLEDYNDWKGCRKKALSFASERVALIAAAGVSERTGKKLGCYHCKQCKQYHLYTIKPYTKKKKKGYVGQ